MLSVAAEIILRSEVDSGMSANTPDEILTKKPLLPDKKNKMFFLTHVLSNFPFRAVWISNAAIIQILLASFHP